MRTVETLVRSYPLEVQTLAHGARGLIRRLVPAIEESVDSSAPVIAYGYGAGYRGMVCTLILSKSGVKLGLVRGADLDDPYGLLKGRGKVHRYVQLEAPGDLRRAGVSLLIKAADSACRQRNRASRRKSR